MGELEIDISGHRSESVEAYEGSTFDFVVTVCDKAKESCPAFPGPARTLHWSFEDPAEAIGTDEQRRSEFRKVRDEIRAKVLAFAAGPDTAE